MILRLCFAVILSGLVLGCGSSKPDAVAVTGKVIFRKKTPAAGAMVVFHPVDPELEKRIGGKPVGTVGDDGTFKLTSYTEGDGAPEGEYGVTIDWRKQKETKMAFGDGGGSSGPLLNPKYSNPATPFTKVTVKKGEANNFEFDVD